MIWVLHHLIRPRKLATLEGFVVRRSAGTPLCRTRTVVSQLGPAAVGQGQDRAMRASHLGRVRHVQRGQCGCLNSRDSTYNEAVDFHPFWRFSVANFVAALEKRKLIMDDDVTDSR
jgi:hypothetical protein